LEASSGVGSTFGPTHLFTNKIRTRLALRVIANRVLECGSLTLNPTQRHPVSTHAALDGGNRRADRGFAPW
jgi:hypothetical protein